MERERMKPNIIFNSIQISEFSYAYPYINNYIVNNGDFVFSRNGDTREVIDFKTEITNPYRRCVGNNKRDINIFFLMAEALWIWAGRKDVSFLTKFNSRMVDFSDDKIYFHAPYGFRLRHHGLSSWDNTKRFKKDSNKHDLEFFEGTDQIKEALEMLSNDSESRRVVLQIWDANLDLNHKTKDLPCNDLVMLKIRNGKLRTTIANRSNDLHWGLPTNVFQFSFITEIMSQILGVELGTQTHNSQSLHFYTDNPIAMNMNDEFVIQDGYFRDIYDDFKELRMNFNFTSEGTEQRLREVDFWINKIIESLETGYIWDTKFSDDLKKFDEYLWRMYHLLHIYIEYKNTGTSDKSKVHAINKINEFSLGNIQYDFEALAINFFTSKLKDKSLLENYCFNF